MIWEAIDNDIELYASTDESEPKLKKVTLDSQPLGKSQGFLQGFQIQPGDIAERCFDVGWKDAFNLHTMVATILSESQGYDRAYNDNINDDGVTTSRDVGLCQINIPASKIGTSDEEALYDWQYNIVRARALYDNPSNDEDGIRGFQPWYGYVLRVYLRDTYQKRAGRGVGNFLINKAFRFPTDMLAGVPYEHKLQLPVLDYRYRLQGMQTYFDQGKAKTYEIKRNVTSLANKNRCDDLARILANGKAQGSA